MRVQKFKYPKLSPKQVEFFQAKGKAFRELWLPRLLKKGVTQAQIDQLNRLIEAFHATEEPGNV